MVPTVTSLTRSPAISIDPQLARVVFWIAVACCVVAQAAIIRAAVRTRGDGDGAAGATVPRPSRASELGWTLIPAAALAAVLALTWQALGR